MKTAGRISRRSIAAWSGRGCSTTTAPARTLFATAGVMAENRAGGTLDGAVAPDGLAVSRSAGNASCRHRVMARWLTAGGRVVSVRGSFTRQTRDREFGGVLEFGRRITYFGEASLLGTRGRHTWVVGTAFQQDRFDLRELPQFDYRFSSPAVFAQDEITVSPKLTIAASARADFHSEYGVLATPRISVLTRPDANWTIRASIGTGAFTPTPFTEETDETGLSRVQPLHDLRAERAVGGSVDVTRELGPVEITGTVFGSRVAHALQSRDVSASSVELFNAAESTRTRGTELMVRYKAGGFTAMATHAWTHSTEPDPDTGVRREVPLTAATRGLVQHHLGGRARPVRHRGLLHRAAAARGQPVSPRGRPLLAGRVLRRAALRPRAAFRQSREPVRRPPDQGRPADPAGPAAGRPLDRGRLGAARRPGHQRGSPDRVPLSSAGGVTGGMISSSGPCGERV